ncbi:MAG TPA: hypothetical protein VGO14_09110 [Solirubrobacteraceae bacterium]|jgi:hypothetical protein|nr:hypothetical protein [Solirubrobacteraceae bacterium]
MSEVPEQLDEQQAQLVDRLRAAQGAAVSFEELRGIGIENPALLCYELAAVGLPITRTASPAEGMPVLSVRLEPDAGPSAAEDGSGDQPRGDAPASVGRLAGSARARHLASLKPRVFAAAAALLAVLGAVIAVALGELAQGPSAGVGRVASRVQGPAAPSTHGRPPPAGPSQPPNGPGEAQPKPPTVGVVPAAAPTQVSPAAAVELESEGHRLLLEGSFASAIPVLDSAVRASGQSLARCVEPTSEVCLTFAYALYDLGRALRLEGRRGEAVSVLIRRLSIDNQRPTVQRELDLALGARA